MLARSPDRGSFNVECEMKKVEEGTKTPAQAEEMIEYFKTWQQQRLDLESTDEWKKDNMEYDLRSTQWIIDKVKADDIYAQHLYAAICNNEFIKNDVWPILTEKTWSASWRSAGGIVANMQEKGDYIDWYCSGIRGDKDWDDDQFRQATKEQQEYYLQQKAYVSESVVTDEIRQDLFKLGWLVKEDNDKDVL
jgi:hypothetical protein